MQSKTISFLRRLPSSLPARRWRRAVGLVAAGASAVVLAGCGGGTTASVGAGSEVLVQVIAPLTGSNGAYEPWVNAVKGTVEAINASGAAGDRKIKLDICDAQQNANTAAACGSKTVRNGAVAALTMLSNEQAYLPFLEKERIPALGFMVDPTMFTSPISYSTASAGAAGVQGVFGLAKSQGCRELVLLRADPQPAAAVAAYADNWRKAAATVGIPTEIVQTDRKSVV